MSQLAASEGSNGEVVLPIGLPAGILSRGPEDPAPGEGLVWASGDFRALALPAYALWAAAFSTVDLSSLLSWAEGEGLPSPDRIHDELRHDGLLVHASGDLARSAGVLRGFHLHLCARGLANSQGDPALFILAGPDGSARLAVSAVLYPVLFESSRGTSLWDACAEAAGHARVSQARVCEEALRSLPDLIRGGFAFLDRSRERALS